MEITKEGLLADRQGLLATIKRLEGDIAANGGAVQYIDMKLADLDAKEAAKEGPKAEDVPVVEEKGEPKAE